MNLDFNNLLNIFSNKNKLFVSFKGGRLFLVQSLFKPHIKILNLRFYFLFLVLKNLYHYGLIDINFLKLKIKNIYI